MVLFKFRKLVIVVLTVNAKRKLQLLRHAIFSFAPGTDPRCYCRYKNHLGYAIFKWGAINFKLFSIWVGHKSEEASVEKTADSGFRLQTIEVKFFTRILYWFPLLVRHYLSVSAMKTNLVYTDVRVASFVKTKPNCVHIYWNYKNWFPDASQQLTRITNLQLFILVGWTFVIYTNKSITHEFFYSKNKCTLCYIDQKHTFNALKIIL